MSKRNLQNISLQRQENVSKGIFKPQISQGRFSSVLVTLLINLGDSPLLSSIMDEYLQVIKRPSPDPQIFHQQTLKANETKNDATTLASWLMKQD